MRSRLKDKTVCFFIDNTPAMAYLNRQGGHSLALLHLTFRIWKLAEQLKVMIIPGHIAGQRNVLADLASRKGQVLQSEFAMSRRSSSPDRSDGSDMAAGQRNIAFQPLFLMSKFLQRLAKEEHAKVILMTL